MIYSYMSDQAWKHSISQAKKLSDLDYLEDLFTDAKKLAKERRIQEKFLGARGWCLVSKQGIKYDDFNAIFSSEKKKAIPSIKGIISGMGSIGIKKVDECVKKCSSPGSTTTCAIIIDDERMEVSKVAYFGEVVD